MFVCALVLGHHASHASYIVSPWIQESVPSRWKVVAAIPDSRGQCPFLDI